MNLKQHVILISQNVSFDQFQTVKRFCERNEFSFLVLDNFTSLIDIFIKPNFPIAVVIYDSNNHDSENFFEFVSACKHIPACMSFWNHQQVTTKLVVIHEHQTVLQGCGQVRTISRQLFDDNTLENTVFKLNKAMPVNCPSGINLTPRECQILDLIQNRGASNKIIARTLNISESTIKLHVGRILKKFGCRNRTQLAVFSK